MRETGKYQNLGEMSFFIPYSLPPNNPPFEMSSEIMVLYGEASFALGQLNEMSRRLPDPKRFLKAYVIKEALLSSAIEGIHTTLIEVFTHPLSGSKPNKDTQLVLNYTKALDTALKMLQEENFPLVSRVILEAHSSLMSAGEGDKASPGVYRKQSVKVGELIPPPATEIPNLISVLEKYINEPSDLPILIRTGLVHVQFETIHPFLDGNGRIGRLLIVLMLIENGLLDMPIIYPSYYFKKHHFEYYQRLDGVRTKGDFEGWISYYLKAIRDSAFDAYFRAKEIEELEKKIKQIIREDKQFIKIRETADLVLGLFFAKPISSITEISKNLDKAYNTISNIIKHFIDLEIIVETTDNKRNKFYRFHPYLAILEKD
jgi:Fic family protein